MTAAETTEHDGAAEGDGGITVTAVTTVVAMHASSLETDPVGARRMAWVEAESRVADQGLTLPEGDEGTLYGTHHELLEALDDEGAPEYLAALEAEGHDLMDLAFLVWRVPR